MQDLVKRRFFGFLDCQEEAVNAEKTMRFLVCLPSPKVGDFLLITPMLAALRARFPGASVTLLLRKPDPGEWITRHPLVDQVIWCNSTGKQRRQGLWKLARELRQGHFDVGIYRGCSAHHVWAMRLARIPMRIAGPYSYFRCLLTYPAGSTRERAERHEVEYNLDLLRPLGIASLDKRVCFPLFYQEHSEASNLLLQESVPNEALLIALNLGYGGSSRLWPVEHFREAAERLVRQTGARILLIGQEEALPFVASDCSILRDAVIDLRGRTTLGLLGALLQRCRLHISVDTGTAHVAAAMNTPCVTLFPDGRAWDEHRRWRPWQTPQRLLGPARRCPGCEKRCHRQGRECLDSITVAQVVDAAAELLADFDNQEHVVPLPVGFSPE